MTRKPLLSKCDCCKQAKQGTEYRRYADKARHGVCITCEDLYKSVKRSYKSPAQNRKADYNRDYYDRFVRRTPVRRSLPSAPSAVAVQTKWADANQGAQA